MYKERDEEKRREFIEKILQYKAEDIVYLDQSGIDHQVIDEYHWSRIGCPDIGERSGASRERTSLLGAVCENRVLAPFCLKGSTNRDVFVYWLKNYLVPELKQGQVVVMDNASIHKSLIVKEVIENAGCELLYLAPYSPDLNPIEHYWANLKKFITKIKDNFQSFHDAIDFAFSQLNTQLTF